MKKGILMIGFALLSACASQPSSETREPAQTGNVGAFTHQVTAFSCPDYIKKSGVKKVDTLGKQLKLVKDDLNLSLKSVKDYLLLDPPKNLDAGTISLVRQNIERANCFFTAIPTKQIEDIQQTDYFKQNRANIGNLIILAQKKHDIWLDMVAGEVNRQPLYAELQGYDSIDSLGMIATLTWMAKNPSSGNK